MSERASRTRPGFPSGGPASNFSRSPALQTPTGGSGQRGPTPSSSRVEKRAEFLWNGEEQARNRCGRSREDVLPCPVRQSLPAGPQTFMLLSTLGTENGWQGAAVLGAARGWKLQAARAPNPEVPAGLQPGAPRARRGVVQAARPGAHCAPRALRGHPTSLQDWGFPPGAAAQAELLRSLGGCCARRSGPRGGRAPGRLCARLAGIWGCPSGVGVGAGAGCGAGLPAARRERESGELTPRATGAASRVQCALSGVALGPPALSFPGPPAVGVPPAVEPAGVSAPPRPGLLARHLGVGARRAAPRRLEAESDTDNSRFWGPAQLGAVPLPPPLFSSSWSSLTCRSQCLLRPPSFHVCTPPSPKNHSAPKTNTPDNVGFQEVFHLWPHRYVHPGAPRVGEEATAQQHLASVTGLSRPPR